LSKEFKQRSLLSRLKAKLKSKKKKKNGTNRENVLLLHTTALLSLIHVTIPKIATSICCKKKQQQV